jgi:hypothetical protein
MAGPTRVSAPGVPEEVETAMQALYMQARDCESGGCADITGGCEQAESKFASLRSAILRALEDARAGSDLFTPEVCHSLRLLIDQHRIVYDAPVNAKLAPVADWLRKREKSA